MTTADAATIAAIREKTAESLRITADALSLIQAPIGRPADTAAINQLLADRSRQLFQATQGKILTVQEAADALSISRQRAYVLLAEEQKLRASLLRGLKDSANGRTQELLPPDYTATPAHTQLPETAL